MTNEQLEALTEGDKLTAFGEEAVVQSIDRQAGYAALHVERPIIDPEGATATVPVSLDGLLSHWELVE